MNPLCKLLFASFSSTGVLSARDTDNGLAGHPSFASFVSAHGRTYSADSNEYTMRQGIYSKRLQQVQHHNSNTDRRWTATINHLSDRTDAELLQLRGLRVMRASSTNARAPGMIAVHNPGAQFLGQFKSAVIPTEKSWAHLETVKRDVDQSACGSCWAIATSIMLDANAEINKRNRTFSAQELVNCVPNPHNCGGNGGCKGATVELAMNWAMDRGLQTDDETPYTGVDGTCAKSTPALLATQGSDALKEMIAIGFHGVKSANSPGALIGLRGWERLPENQYEPLIRAVAETGPVAVSVAASGWQSYGSGIFDGCDKDAVIDHAVTLIGYGVDKDRAEKYWIIKNSWGSSWGENDGTIRLLRHEGNEHCGTDYQPKEGTACDGGPSSVPVCGMCGILYDAVVPYFHKM